MIRSHTCKDCGKSFTGGPNAQRCLVCRVIRIQAYQKEYLSNPRGRMRIGNKNKFIAEKTGRPCKYCKKEVIHYKDRQGSPVGEWFRDICSRSECRAKWSAQGDSVAPGFEYMTGMDFEKDFYGDGA